MTQEKLTQEPLSKLAESLVFAGHNGICFVYLPGNNDVIAKVFGSKSEGGMRIHFGEERIEAKTWIECARIIAARIEAQ